MTYKVIVSNTELDIERGAKLSLTKENQFWQFDNFNLSRSQAIFLPATPKNNTFFGFSNNPAEYGLNARISYDAEIWYSGGKIEGKMFVIDFHMRKGYNCLFIFGELLKLKEIKEAGNIGNYVNMQENIVWNEDTPILPIGYYNPFGLSSYLIENIGVSQAHFDKTKMNFMPSVSLMYLADAAASFFNVLIDKTNLLFYTTLNVKLNGMNAQAGVGLLNDLSLDANKEFKGFDSSYWEKGTRYVSENYGPEVYGNNLPILRAKENIRVSFFFKYGDAPDPYPNSYYIHGLLIYRDNAIIYSQTVKTQNFTMNILAGDEIALFTILDLGTIYRYQKFAPDIELFRLTYTSTLEKLTYPGTYRLQPNLPEVTLIDILKTFANLSEAGLYFDNGLIKFFNYDFQSLPEKLQVVSENILKRSVLNYAQNNIIDFASSQNVKSTSKLTKSIEIQNESLERERNIYTIPFSEGNVSEHFGIPMQSIPDIVIKTDENGNKTYEFGQDKDTLINTTTVQPQFKTGKLSEILQNSTSIEIVAKQTLREFMQFDEFTTFLHRNKRWSWANAQWDNGLTKFELIRIPDMITLFGYVAEVAKLKIVITGNDFLNAKSKLKFSYNNKEIFPNYNDELDNVLVPKNLLLKSGEEVTNNKYLLNKYTPSEWLIQDEVYTALYDIKLKDNATRIFPHMSSGYEPQQFYISNPIVGVRSVQIATGIARYKDGRTPQDNPINGNLGLYIRPNEESTGGADNTIYKIKVEKGSNPNPVWTPAPIDSVSIFDKSANVTASIVEDELVVTEMSGNDGWVDMKFEYLNFEEIKRIEIIKN